MKLLDSLRNLFNIRTARAYPEPGALPQIGSSIVLNNFRIKLKYPLNNEQWQWFSSLGWRSINMRTERRKYVCLPDKVLVKLLEADTLNRELLHQKLLNSGDSIDHKLWDDGKKDGAV